MNSADSNKSTRIVEADIIRIILILMLVLYHAFAPWSGAWIPIDEDSDNSFYWWIAKFSYSFFLESFVFLSGYLMGHHVTIRGRELLSFRNLVLKKFQHLIIPSIIFSTIYVLSFGINENESLKQVVYFIVSGRGHMWFLPMLFWCFVGFWLINKFNISNNIVLLFLSLLSILSNFILLPFRLGSTAYYLVFFYTGYTLKVIYQEKLLLLSKPTYIISFCCGFTIFFIIGTMFGEIINYKEPLKILNYVVPHSLLQNLMLSISNLFKLIYSMMAICSLFTFTIWLCYERKIKISPVIASLSKCCFGIYIIQQFILKWLYYHSHLIDKITVEHIPWIGFVIALSLSIIGSFLLLKTRIGNFLIG